MNLMLLCSLLAQVDPTWSLLPNKLHRSRSLVRVSPPFSSVDEYEQFAAEFGQTLQLEHADEASLYYRRDRHDTSPLPKCFPVISELLNERYRARTGKQFDRVHDIDQQLAEHGIFAYDYPPIWTSRRDRPLSHQRRQREQQYQVLQDKHGLTGHPYQQVPTVNATSSLPLPIVHELLRRRTLCRNQGHFEEADAIKFELWLHGVRVDDDRARWWYWSAEDVLTNETLTTTTTTTTILTGVDYSPDEHLRLPPMTEEEERRFRQRAEQLVALRAKALACGDNVEASFLRLELARTYNVLVNDTTREWTAVDADESANDPIGIPRDSSPSHSLPILFGDSDLDTKSPIYRESSHSVSVSDPMVAERIRALVHRRVRKREQGKWLEGDALRKELWRTYVSTV